MITWVLRGYIMVAMCMLYVNPTPYQHLIDHIYHYLSHHPFYQSVYFETFFAVSVASFYMFLFSLLKYIPYFHPYRMENKKDLPGIDGMKWIRYVVQYVWPLMVLDTFTKKYYPNVPMDTWLAMGSKVSFQTYRLLPLSAPPIHHIFIHTFLSILLYDFLFYFEHRLLHKYLFHQIHAIHHRHPPQHCIESTNTAQLHIIERLMIILTANLCLNLVGAHPFTRTLFILLFIYLLVESHAGYNLPFSSHHIIPFQLCGGAIRHIIHHRKGNIYFQPFFTYLDDYFPF